MPGTTKNEDKKIEKSYNKGLKILEDAKTANNNNQCTKYKKLLDKAEKIFKKLADKKNSKSIVMLADIYRMQTAYYADVSIGSTYSFADNINKCSNSAINYYKKGASDPYKNDYCKARIAHYKGRGNRHEGTDVGAYNSNIVIRSVITLLDILNNKNDKKTYENTVSFLDDLIQFIHHNQKPDLIKLAKKLDVKNNNEYTYQYLADFYLSKPYDSINLEKGFFYYLEAEKLFNLPDESRPYATEKPLEDPTDVTFIEEVRKELREEDNNENKWETSKKYHTYYLASKKVQNPTINDDLGELFYIIAEECIKFSSSENKEINKNSQWYKEAIVRFYQAAELGNTTAIKKFNNNPSNIRIVCEALENGLTSSDIDNTVIYKPNDPQNLTLLYNLRKSLREKGNPGSDILFALAKQAKLPEGAKQSDEDAKVYILEAIDQNPGNFDYILETFENGKNYNAETHKSVNTIISKLKKEVLDIDPEDSNGAYDFLKKPENNIDEHISLHLLAAHYAFKMITEIGVWEQALVTAAREHLKKAQKAVTLLNDSAYVNFLLAFFTHKLDGPPQNNNGLARHYINLSYNSSPNTKSDDVIKKLINKHIPTSVLNTDPITPSAHQQNTYADKIQIGATTYSSLINALIATADTNPVNLQTFYTSIADKFYPEPSARLLESVVPKNKTRTGKAYTSLTAGKTTYNGTNEDISEQAILFATSDQYRRPFMFFSCNTGPAYIEPEIIDPQATPPKSPRLFRINNNNFETVTPIPTNGVAIPSIQLFTGIKIDITAGHNDNSSRLDKYFKKG